MQLFLGVVCVELLTAAVHGGVAGGDGFADAVQSVCAGGVFGLNFADFL